MSQERIVNYILFLINDSLLEAWEIDNEQERQNFLKMREDPAAIQMAVNWVMINQKFLRIKTKILHNPELERIALDGIRMSYAHSFTGGKMYDGQTSSQYAKHLKEVYETMKVGGQNGSGESI